MDAEELRRRRRALGLSQAELGKRLGEPQQVIGRWESGARRITHAGMLDLALRALEREREPVEHMGVAIDAAALSARRGAAGLTQVELGQRAGVRSETISRLESGARSHVYPVTLGRLAAALGCDAEALTDDG